MYGADWLTGSVGDRRCSSPCQSTVCLPSFHPLSRATFRSSSAAWPQVWGKDKVDVVSELNLKLISNLTESPRFCLCPCDVQITPKLLPLFIYVHKPTTEVKGSLSFFVLHPLLIVRPSVFFFFCFIALAVPSLLCFPTTLNSWPRRNEEST